MNLGVSQLTKTIYAGKSERMPNGIYRWTGKKTDVTHEALNAVFEFMYLKSKESGEYQYSVQGIGTLKFELAEEKEKMSLNQGYLLAEKDAKSDEKYTPFYCVEPILKYVKKSMTIWCPFDKNWSAYVKMLEANGNKVIFTHIDDGNDFFEYEPEEYDAIISNPPFSKKDDVIRRLYELKKPFAILLPMNSLQGINRYEYFKKGIQLLCFDQRVGFHAIENMEKTEEGSPFASAYFCKDILPNDLIIEHLEKYDRPLLM